MNGYEVVWPQSILYSNSVLGSNAQLGEYFRRRLKLNNGSYVHAKDLISYGRTDVTFYKIDDEQFYMDFSVNK